MYTCIGTIVDTQGLGGSLRLKENIDLSEFFNKFDKVLLKSGEDFISFDLTNIVKHNKKGWVISLKNISDVSSAETFILRDVYISSSLKDGDEEFNIQEVDIDFFTHINGKRYILKDILENGNEDLLSFIDEEGKSLYIPNIDHFVIDINYDSGEIVLQNYEGLDEI